MGMLLVQERRRQVAKCAYSCTNTSRINISVSVYHEGEKTNALSLYLRLMEKGKKCLVPDTYIHIYIYRLCHNAKMLLISTIIFLALTAGMYPAPPHPFPLPSGFRLVEKYALLVGGAATHRQDLSQMVMLKGGGVGWVLYDNARIYIERDFKV